MGTMAYGMTTGNAYDKLVLNKYAYFMLVNGKEIWGDVIGNDKEWVTLCTRDGVWYISKKFIMAFCV